MTNRNLLKEAIADAKAVKETAIANAKAALTEAFNPLLIQSLSEKLAEMDEEDENLNEEQEEINEYAEEQPKDKEEAHFIPKKDKVKEEEEFDLDELLRELDEKEEEMNENMLNDPKIPTSKGNVAEAEEEMVNIEDEDADGVPDSEDEEIDITNMEEEDLKSFIEDVISDMVDNGELEAGENMGGEAEEEIPELDDEEGEGEINIDMVAEAKKESDSKIKKLEKDLKEAYDTLKSVKAELNETNIFNAKLLYTNKLFKEKNLSENQKIKTLAAFDKAVSVKEAKLVYETLSEGLNKNTKTPINESLLKSAASKISGVAPKKPILEVNSQFERWQILAGIKK